MLCTWSWLGRDSSIVQGPYQSDTDDLKDYMARYHGIDYLYCERQDGKRYFWRNPKATSYSFKRAGWIALQ